MKIMRAIRRTLILICICSSFSNCRTERINSYNPIGEKRDSVVTRYDESVYEGELLKGKNKDSVLLTLSGEYHNDTALVIINKSVKRKFSLNTINNPDVDYNYSGKSYRFAYKRGATTIRIKLLKTGGVAVFNLNKNYPIIAIYYNNKIWDVVYQKDYKRIYTFRIIK